MPELPEVEAYVHALRPRIEGRLLERVRIASVSLLKTVEPSPAVAEGSGVVSVGRAGKRLVLELDAGLFLVLHLMVAGRLHWRQPGAPMPRKVGLAALDFPTGSLILTEAGTTRRARMWLVVGREALARLDPGGIEVEQATPQAFRAAVLAERHTLKRALTDARLLSGIGGAFADEILHRARLSPLQLNVNLSVEEMERLRVAARDILGDWRRRRIAEAGDGFPDKVTAFHPAMSVHGKAGQPCPVCGTMVRRIVYAERETDYCPSCQTGGRILADRSLSRLLRDAYPRRIEDLEG